MGSSKPDLWNIPPWRCLANNWRDDLHLPGPQGPGRGRYHEAEVAFCLAVPPNSTSGYPPFQPTLATGGPRSITDSGAAAKGAISAPLGPRVFESMPG